jgi:hypothetical protein
MVAPNPQRPIQRFHLRQVVLTPGAISALERAFVSADVLLERHQRGDYGDVCQEDWKANDEAVVNGERVLSSYKLHTGEKIWIITEADRSATTLLLPEDY